MAHTLQVLSVYDNNLGASPKIHRWRNDSMRMVDHSTLDMCFHSSILQGHPSGYLFYYRKHNLWINEILAGRIKGVTDAPALRKF